MDILCKDLKLTIYKEGEQVRIVLVSELEMQELSVCYPITEATEKTQQSRRYFVKEAIVLALRRVVSEAFNQGMITDALGTWTISKPATKETSSTSFEIELELQ